MSNTKNAPRHARSNSLVGQPQATAMPAGSVAAIDGAGLPAVHTPNEADIYKAIGELEKKIQQLSRNQKTIETKLEHIAARVDAANANLIMGVQFLTKVMNSIGWWASGDVKTSEQTWPANPHWH